jgi:hypothetical protein
MHFSLHTTVPANGSCCPAAQLYSQSLLMPVHPSWSDPIPLYLQLKKKLQPRIRCHISPAGTTAHASASRGPRRVTKYTNVIPTK